jgi:hypothetical protein
VLSDEGHWSFLLGLVGIYLAGGVGMWPAPGGGWTTEPMRDDPLSAGISGAGAGREGGMGGWRGTETIGGSFMGA